MAKQIDPSEYDKIPISKVTEPFDGAVVMLDRWWVVLDECILRYRGFSYQCNSIKSITEKIGKRLYGDVEIRLIPCVYVEQEIGIND